MALELTVMSLDFEAEEATRTATYDKVELKVGRDPANDVLLSGEDVSAFHALITLDTSNGSPRIYVTDLGSTNGTLIDSKRLPVNQPFLLEATQRILIGEYLIKPSMITELASKAASGIGSNNDHQSIELEKRPDIRIIKGGKIIHTDLASDNEDADPASVLDDISDSFIDYAADAVQSKEQEAEELVIELDTVEDIAESKIEPQPIKKAEDKKKKTGVTVKNATKSVATGATPVKATVGADSCEFNLIARKIISLCGTVLHKGIPLAGVVVDAGIHGSATTDESGDFEFPGIVEGSAFEVAISKASYSFDGTTFAGTVEEDDSLVFEATELFIISGSIIHRGVALEGVTIDGGTLGTTITDSEGRYEFTDVPEGTELTLTASKDGYIFEIA